MKEPKLSFNSSVVHSSKLQSSEGASISSILKCAFRNYSLLIQLFDH